MGVCFLAMGGALLIFTLFLTTASVDSLISQGKVWGESASGQVVVRIAGITEPLYSFPKSKSYLYLIAVDGRDELVFFEAKENDQTVKSMVEHYEALEDNPRPMIVQVEPTSDIQDFTSILLDEDLGLQEYNVNPVYYLSAYERESDNSTNLAVGAIVVLLGLGFIGGGIYRVSKNRKLWGKLESLVPETYLMENPGKSAMDFVLENGDYVDPQFQVFVYKDQLISLAKVLAIVDLTECNDIRARLTTTRYYGIIPVHKEYTFILRNHAGKIITIIVKNLKKETDNHIGAFYDFLNQRYPNVHITMG